MQMLNKYLLISNKNINIFYIANVVFIILNLFKIIFHKANLFVKKQFNIIFHLLMRFCYKSNNKPVFEFNLYLHDNIKYICSEKSIINIFNS